MIKIKFKEYLKKRINRELFEEKAIKSIKNQISEDNYEKKELSEIINE